MKSQFREKMLKSWMDKVNMSGTALKEIQVNKQSRNHEG